MVVGSLELNGGLKRGQEGIEGFCQKHGGERESDKQSIYSKIFNVQTTSSKWDTASSKIL